MVSREDAAATWDARLLDFAGHSLYQTSRWGEYKNTNGWHARYLQAEDDGEVVGMLQALVRMYPLRTLVAWCPGGPVGSLAVSTADSMRQIAQLSGARVLYCRSTFLRERCEADEHHLRSHGWSRPDPILSANKTAVWNLRQTDEQLLAGMNRNWRYSLRQAEKRQLAIQRLDKPPVEELMALCDSMNAAKGVRAITRASGVAALFDALGDRAVVYGCRNDAGELIAFHSCGIHGDRAWELVAATSPEGRSSGASFAVLWALVLHCRRLGLTHYDLGGVDPLKAPGVADFKRWTGAQDVEWLGEWEWSTSSLLRRAVDVAVRHRTASTLP